MHFYQSVLFHRFHSPPAKIFPSSSFQHCILIPALMYSRSPLPGPGSTGPLAQGSQPPPLCSGNQTHTHTAAQGPVTCYALGCWDTSELSVLLKRSQNVRARKNHKKRRERVVMRVFEMTKLINGQFLDGKTQTPQYLALFTPSHSLISPSQSFTRIFFLIIRHSRKPILPYNPVHTHTPTPTHEHKYTTHKT